MEVSSDSGIETTLMSQTQYQGPDQAQSQRVVDCHKIRDVQSKEEAVAQGRNIAATWVVSGIGRILCALSALYTRCTHAQLVLQGLKVPHSMS